MTNVAVTPVRTAREMDEFIDLPWSIYDGASKWIPPLKSEVRTLLNTSKHPFWRSAERELFLARRGDEVVGRIVALIDRAFNEFQGQTSGAWGFFECRDDEEAASALFYAAEDWVRDRSMNFIRGPLNPSTNYEIGMLIEGFEHAPTIMMTYNPLYYPKLVHSAGYVKEKDLLALLIEETDRTSQRVERLARRITRKNNLSVRPFNKKDFIADTRLMADIYHECWRENWGFVPMNDGEVDLMAQNLRRIADTDLVVFVYHGDDPAGVALILPDINPLLKRLNGKIGVLGLMKLAMYRREITGLRGLLFGFRKRYQKIGLPLVAFDYVNRVGREKNYKYLELGWNLEDNASINQFDKEVGGRVYKRYRIYGKGL